LGEQVKTLAMLRLLPAVALADATSATTVIDGDTLEIGGDRIRLFGTSPILSNSPNPKCGLGWV
jgi:endonuclease YncB( thermonuclease family)